ncbi:MAG: hypothetical protein ACYC0M_00080 [Burkholderiales bacterium]
MNRSKKVQLAFILLASLTLSGCGGGGGGGGSAPPPAPPPVTSSPPPNTSLQLWAPYFTITGTTSGSATTYTDGNLSVDSIINPNNHNLLSIPTLDALNPYTNIQNIDSSGILTASGTGYILNGARYFFFSNNGKLYSLDLTSQTFPVPVQLGTLANLTEVCGIQAEQSDGTGQTGAVLVSGATSGTSPSNCTAPQSWVVPFNTPASTVIPEQAHTFLVTTFINSSSGSLTTSGFVIGTTTSVNVTTDLTQPGIVTNVPFNPSVGNTLASEKGGNATNQFVWVDNTSSTSSTSYLYLVSSSGNATLVSGGGFPYSNISANTASDEYGNLYLVATSGASGNYTLTVYKVTLSTALASVIYTVNNITSTTVSSDITVKPDGTGGLLTVIEPGSTTPIQNIVFNTSTAALLRNYSTLANSNSYQFIGLDSSGIFNAEDANTSQNDLYRVDLGTGNVVTSLPNQYLVSPVWGSNFISAANPFYESYGYLLAAAYQSGTQTLTGAASVIETQNYTTTAAFSLPPGTTSFVPAYISTSPHYIMGVSSGSTYNLFAVVPSTNLSTPATPVPLGTNSSNSTTTVNWNGY